MAAAVYTTDLVDIITEMASSTGWSLISDGGGGANSFSVPETDDYVQGANCISRNPWTAANTRGMVYNSTQTVAAGNAVFVWWKADVAQALRTKVNGGIQVLVGSGTGDLKCYYADGSDTYTFGGWKCTPIDPTLTASATLGSPTATTSYFGVRWGVAVSGPSKGFPYKIDAIRRGRTLQCVSGDLGNGYATFAAAGTWQGDLTRQWGLLQFKDGSYTQQGLFLMGTATTAVDFRDSNRTIAIAATDFVSSTFNTFEIRNAASRVDWTAISIQALGTVSKGRLLVTNDATVNIDGCTFTDMDTFSFQSASIITGTTFRRCGAITQNGATISGSLISRSTAAIALTLNDITSLDTTTFVSAGTGHAINGFSTAGSYTLNGLTFTGYAGANGSTGNEAIHVTATTGTVNLTVAGGGNTPSIRTSGATVNVISGSVNATVKVTTTAGTNIANANVFLKAAAGGPFPINAAVTIVNSGTTATVTHTGHPYATNDKVFITGASLIQNRGVFTITVTGANTYTYTMGSAPGASPTGSITSTFVVLFGLTNASGIVTMGRVFPSDQPVVGWARKSTIQPFYKTGGIGGTVSSTTGLNSTIQLLPD